jgi:hypothetical protein
MTTATTLPPLDPTTVLGQGGFGTVYAGRPGYCTKVFRTPLDAARTIELRILSELVERCRPSDREMLTTRFAWPVAVYGEPGATGFEMARVPATAMFDLTVAGRTTSQPLQAKYLIDARYWRGRAIGSVAPTLHPDDRLEVCLDLHAALCVLHGHGLAYRDLSANNVCFTTSRPRRVFLLDADSVVDVDRPAAEPGTSPDWDVPPAGLLEQDRARFSLLVWRLFRQHPTARPGGGAIGEGVDEATAQRLERCYRTGDVGNFEQLAGELRRLLSPARREQLRREAERSGFARFVVRAGAGSDHEQVASATVRMAAEERCEATTGARRRMHLRSLARRSGPFHVDVAPETSPGSTGGAPVPGGVPSSQHALHRWFVDARFEQLADLFARGRLEPLAADPWLGRAVAHAHCASGTPEVTVTPHCGSVQVDVSWPPETFVNHATLILEFDDTTTRLGLSRPDGASRSSHAAPCPQGTVVRWTLRPGTHSTSGATILAGRYLGGSAATPGQRRAGVPSTPSPVAVGAPSAAGTAGASGWRGRHPRARAAVVAVLAIALVVVLWLLARSIGAVLATAEVPRAVPAPVDREFTDARPMRTAHDAIADTTTGLEIR